MPSRTVIVKANGEALKQAKFRRGDEVKVSIIIIEEGQDVALTTFKFAARQADLVDSPSLIAKSGTDFDVAVNGNRLDANFTIQPTDTKPQFVGPPFAAPIALDYEIERGGPPTGVTTLERGRFTVLDDIA